MTTPSTLELLPCLDSEERAATHQRLLDISRLRAVELGQSAVDTIERGYYLNPSGQKVDLADAIDRACTSKQSYAPDDPLPCRNSPQFSRTRIQVANETTFEASKRLIDRGLRPLALNFANGVSPGGGFLKGSRAQEEVLCRSSALYQTLVGDPMYVFHRGRPQPDSSDWVIYSPDVPVFRDDGGTELESFWLLSVITSAAPYAPTVGQPETGNLLQSRIHRVLEVASALDYETLVLGAWGCGAFGNDPHRTAKDFRTALETSFSGHFSEAVFAITDWSPERKYLGPFRDAFL